MLFTKDKKGAYSTRASAESPAFGPEGICLLSNYMDKAMQHAQSERIEDGTYFATVPGFEGLWASGKTLEECNKRN